MEKRLWATATLYGKWNYSYRGRHYDVRINGGSPSVVEIFQRDQRHVCVKSLIDPDETWKMWLTHGASLNMKLLKDFAYSIFPSVLQCYLIVS